jgi:DNA-binding XRE family transcriptional regulator
MSAIAANPDDYVTRAEYNALLDRLQDLEDAEFIQAVEADPAGQTYLPVSGLKRILAGEHPLRIWREHRRLSMTQLAEAAKLSQGYLSEIESGRKPGSMAAYRSLARALELDLDDIVPDNPDRA